MYQITEECTGCGMCRQWCPVKAIRGHKKKRHVIESQCISCGVCGRVCGYGAILDDTGCLTRRIPIREWFNPAWDYFLCNGRGKCAAVCPVRCIQIIPLGEVWKSTQFLLSRIYVSVASFVKMLVNPGRFARLVDELNLNGVRIINMNGQGHGHGFSHIE